MKGKLDAVEGVSVTAASERSVSFHAVRATRA